MGTIDRAEQQAENAKTLVKAKEGLKAVSDAIIIMQEFYKQAAKAEVLMQASPIDEDSPGAGFDGAYQGKQSSSKGIIGLLEVIKTDFQRTIRTTTQAEEEAAADFVKLDRSSRSDISGKTTKK